MSPGLARRDGALRELMDDPDCDPVRLARTLERFAIVNRLVSGWDGVFRTRIRRLARARGGRLSILDIGCGGGDVLRRLRDLGRRDGLALDAVGIDPDGRALAVAGRHPSPGIVWRRAHSAELVAELSSGGERFDVVLSNHVLHHLGDTELAPFLADSAALCSGIVLHSDIARSRGAYVAYAAGIAPLAPGTFLRTDGLRSIRRSWRPEELAARLDAPGTAAWRVERTGPFRLLATHDGTAGSRA